MMKFHEKFLFLLLFVLFLGGCGVVKPTSQGCPDNYNSIYFEGKVGIKVQDRYNNGTFKLDFRGDYFKFIINGPLNMGSKVIEKGPFGVEVDKETVKSDFNHWMEGEYGWYFPINKLPDVALIEARINKPSLKDWDFEVLKVQGSCGHSRLVKFKHKSKDVHIKIVFTKIKID